jgi:hypothetical protein
MPYPADGGLHEYSRVQDSEEPDALPCETDQAKPDRVSHDWHVQPYCQRSLRTVGLSRVLLDRGPNLVAWVSSNLVRPARSATTLQPPAFLRELFEVIELPAPCQAESKLTNSIPIKGIAQRKLSKSDQQKCPGRYGARKIFFRVKCNGLCSLRDSLQGPGDSTCFTRPNEPASHSPSPGRTQTSTGKLHCRTCNFSRVAHATQCCKRLNSPRCNFSRIPTERHSRKRGGPVESHENCGKNEPTALSNSIPNRQAFPASRRGTCSRHLLQGPLTHSCLNASTG